MTGCTVHISEKTFRLIRDELSRCRTRILAMAEMDDAADRVYHLNLHLFPVTTPLNAEVKDSAGRRLKKGASRNQ
jgi:hypothetical protein